MKSKIIIMILCLISILTACNNMESTATESMESTESISKHTSSLDMTVLYPKVPLSNYVPETWTYPFTEYPSEWEDIINDWIPPKRDIQDVTQEIHIEGKNKDIFPVVTNEEELQSLISPIYSLRVMTISLNCDNHFDTYFYPLEDAFQNFPVSFLRQVKPGQYYTVNKVYDGGYAYVFFDRPKDLVTGEYLTEDMTDIQVTGCVYAEKRMEKKDFDSIKIGDSIESVIEIDHSAILSKTFWDYNVSISGSGNTYPLSKHLLADGLLVYEYENKDDELFVSEVKFFEDFNYLSPVLESLDQHYVRNYSILPQDYPPEA